MENNGENVGIQKDMCRKKLQITRSCEQEYAFRNEMISGHINRSPQPGRVCKKLQEIEQAR